MAEKGYYTVLYIVLSLIWTTGQPRPFLHLDLGAAQRIEKIHAPFQCVHRFEVARDLSRRIPQVTSEEGGVKEDKPILDMAPSHPARTYHHAAVYVGRIRVYTEGV